MDHEATFRITSRHAEAIFRALAPEFPEDVHPRSRAECTCEDSRTIVLRVRARDISALRASLNMWLRLVSVADEMQAFAPREGGE
ncbi:MAG: KEOPS complex subunit Pcc1 [Methanolinea sp.]|nr:KEOPS complex subunit Pcc1 [Methanolinea sp.]